ncbi:hypothetical protein AWV80_19285 [Cupriavidus sp. UYMU48A]|nr:hypothetical protein AWV80_19285 [Cupriavidus sp. UYMU48A]
MTDATPTLPSQQPGDLSAAMVDLLYRQCNAVLFACRAAAAGSARTSGAAGAGSDRCVLRHAGR